MFINLSRAIIQEHVHISKNIEGQIKIDIINKIHV